MKHFTAQISILANVEGNMVERFFELEDERSFTAAIRFAIRDVTCSDAKPYPLSEDEIFSITLKARRPDSL